MNAPKIFGNSNRRNLPGCRNRRMAVAATAGFGLAAEPSTVEIEQFADNGKSRGTVRLPKVVKTDAQWAGTSFS